MKAVELLGALLGNKSGKGGAGAGILKELVTGALKGSAQSRPRSSGGSSGPGGGGPLGDIVRDALSKFQKRGGGGGGSLSAPSGPSCDDPSHHGIGGGASELDNAQAVVLIRAMVNAAKADGQLDKQEQDNIMKQLGDVTQEEIQFLKQEFAQPLNVRDFSWSVPMGLEEQVYGISLMAIDLDKNKEASYLKDLAHGLRLEPEVCNKIHRHYKAPTIFG